MNLAPKVVAETLAVDPVRVACVGGGPGSDLAGVLKFAEAHDLLDSKFEFTVLDREPAWHRARHELVSTYASEADVTQTFQTLDLSAGSPWTEPWDFADAGLIIFSFVLSEVWSFNKNRSVSQFLDRLISQARSGAVFCYVDNGGSKFTPLVEEEFETREDIRLIGSRDDERMLLSYDEQCSVIEDAFRDRFGQRPKLTGNVALRLWKKK